MSTSLFTYVEAQNNLMTFDLLRISKPHPQHVHHLNASIIKTTHVCWLVGMLTAIKRERRRTENAGVFLGRTCDDGGFFRHKKTMVALVTRRQPHQMIIASSDLEEKIYGYIVRRLHGVDRFINRIWFMYIGYSFKRFRPILEPIF